MTSTVQTKQTGGDWNTLARDITIANTVLTQLRGRMFTKQIHPTEALVFPFNTQESRSVHMVFVPYALGVIWSVDSEVTEVTILPPWRGFRAANADMVVECHPKKVQEVSVGDNIRVRNR